MPDDTKGCALRHDWAQEKGVETNSCMQNGLGAKVLVF